MKYTYEVDDKELEQVNGGYQVSDASLQSVTVTLDEGETMTSVITSLLANGVSAKLGTMTLTVKVADPNGIAARAAAEMDQKGVRTCKVNFNLNFMSMTATATSVTY